MNFGLAFNETIKKYGLKGSAIAAAADVSASMVSRFRSGKAINTESLEKLMAVLEAEPLRYLLTHVVNAMQIPQDSVALAELMSHLDNKETAALLFALAEKVRQEGKPKSEPKV
ncbi:MAG: hypothetical protein DCF15_12180, partial [Phormidesmis priestleyi]